MDLVIEKFSQMTAMATRIRGKHQIGLESMGHDMSFWVRSIKLSVEYEKLAQDIRNASDKFAPFLK